MAYRRKTLRTMSPTTRKLARLAGEAGSLERRLKALVEEVQSLEHDSRALRNHSCVETAKIISPVTDEDEIDESLREFEKEGYA